MSEESTEVCLMSGLGCGLTVHREEPATPQSLPEQLSVEARKKKSFNVRWTWSGRGQQDKHFG